MSVIVTVTVDVATHSPVTDDNDQGLLYLAMTRAEHVPAVLYSGRSEFVERILGALEAQGAARHDR